MASAAAPVVPQTPSPPTLVTKKSIEEFGGCFVRAQDKAGLAWSYVPNGAGGTFSNAGARGSENVYFLSVSDRGRVRLIRIEPADRRSPINARVTQTVDACA
jgi:hypothetical protein